jgi:hypothetical protein
MTGRARTPEVRRARNAAVLWGLVALGGTGTVAALTLWHLARRGRLLRDRLSLPKMVRLPEISPKPEPEPEPDPTEM